VGQRKGARRVSKVPVARWHRMARRRRLLNSFLCRAPRRVQSDIMIIQRERKLSNRLARPSIQSYPIPSSLVPVLSISLSA
jgi:hypothetical protein